MTRLSVVIPALDEADRLPASLQRIHAFLAGDPCWRPAEVIVVDDGSTDETAAATEAMRTPPGVSTRVVRHPFNRGKGAAVRTGFERSVGDLVLLSDADLATPIEAVEVLGARISPDRVVIGSRALDRRMIAIRQPWYRDLMGRTFNRVVRALAVPGIHDTQCGFKLFPGAVARRLAAVQRVDGFAFDVELLLLARLWGLEVVEVAVPWRHVEASRVLAGRHSAQMLRDVLRLGCRRLTRRLPAPPPEVGE
jgi:dolichyl-phosphate beta-glucosyltransferase